MSQRSRRSSSSITWKCSQSGRSFQIQGSMVDNGVGEEVLVSISSDPFVNV